MSHIGEPGSQLSTHHAVRTTLSGAGGPVAALHAVAAEPVATVLLVPGYTGSKEDFAPMLDGMAAAGFDTFAIDLPGQFDSPGPADESAYTPQGLGAVVAGLVASLPAPVLLLGHSYGGLVARAAVLAGAAVAGLTLLDSGPAKLPGGPRRDGLDLGEPLLRAGGAAAAYRVRESMSSRNPAWATVPRALKAFLRKRFIASSPVGLLGMAHGLREEPDRVDELAAALHARDIGCLVVAGEHDDAWTVPEQRIMAGRLGAPFEVVPGAAHSPNTENPRALLGVLIPAWHSWIARSTSGSGAPDKDAADAS